MKIDVFKWWLFHVIYLTDTSYGWDSDPLLYFCLLKALSDVGSEALTVSY